MSNIKQLKSKPAKPELLTDLKPEERRQAMEGGSKEEFFRRLRQVKQWRQERLARLGLVKDSD